MTDKLDFYEVISTLVPGTLLLCWLPVCFPGLLAVHSPKYVDAFAVFALTALAILIGQLILALSSLSEPFLYWTWGGRPSDRALERGMGNYFPHDTAVRIKQKLAEAVSSSTSDASLFLFAMQISDGSGVGRSPRFNSLYAYHRTLVTLVLIILILFLASCRWGAASAWPEKDVAGLVVVLIGVLALVWHRAKQRGIYYVREVLMTAERVLDERTRAKA